MKKALITGVLGQDGRYLARFLLERGYEVHGAIRSKSAYAAKKYPDLEGVHIHEMDVCQSDVVTSVISQIKPQEIYNLASQSFIPLSWEKPIETAQSTALGVIRILEAIKKQDRSIRFFQAGSHEMFGKPKTSPQNELTPLFPQSPYGVAKVYGHFATIAYRQNYGIHASNGILYNHESPLRPERFVTRKITQSAAKIAAGSLECLELGNLHAKRDWGFAGDYVEAMWLMLGHDTPDDYVIASGEAHTVKEVVEIAFSSCGMNLSWEGSGMDEKGMVEGEVRVKVNKEFYRPVDPETLIGDASKAKRILHWKPKRSFADTIKMMAQEDILLLSQN